MVNLRIIQLSFIAGLVTFMAVQLFLRQEGAVILGEDSKGMVFLAAGQMVAAIGMSFILQNPLAEKVSAAKNLQDAQTAYRIMCMFRWAIAEGAGLFCLVVFMSNQDLALVALALVCIAFLVLREPSSSEFESYSGHV